MVFFRTIGRQSRRLAALVLGLAVLWLNTAIAQQDTQERYALAGDVFAQHNLGMAYAEGRSVPQNYTEAARWYRMSARQGYPYSQYELGYLYETGKGISRSPHTATQWYRKAAEQGYASAQSQLGYPITVGRVFSRIWPPPPHKAMPRTNSIW